MSKFKIPYQMMPREKLLQFGAESLTDAELLAIFLRTGYQNMPVLMLAHKLLFEFGSLYHLINADRKTFCEKLGLGPAKYSQLQAIIELSQRYLKIKMTEGNTLLSPDLTHHYLATRLSQEEREIFMVIFLDNQNKVIETKEMFTGTYHSVEVHPREIIREALKLNAAAIILAHNHPSGFAEPSQADRNITDSIEEVCNIVDIRIIDHIVIGKGEYVSFVERGWL